MDNAIAYRTHVESILYALKHRKKIHVPGSFVVHHPSGVHAHVITKADIQREETIDLLAQWRKKSSYWFPTQFAVTSEGTRKWAKSQLIDAPDRILFFLTARNYHKPFGHMGLYRFDYSQKVCEIDNILRGVNIPDTKGAMTASVQKLRDWARQYLGVRRLALRVFADNTNAIRLYERAGFTPIKTIPLSKRVEGAVTSWVEDLGNTAPEREFLVMMYG